MCLVALAIDQSRRFPLVIASNRDEFFKRPAARLAWWAPETGAASVLGGRDLDSGGTWMGLSTQGRLALLTNVRGGLATDAAAPSRGLYGLSNGGLDAPWPKVVALKARLATAMDAAASADELATQLFAALGDRHIADDKDLPRTGVPMDWERQLSAAFIRTPDQSYGTRCTTLIITERVGRQPVTHVLERSFNASGGVALLRRATLRNWPPRYTEAVSEGADAAIEEAVVAESELAPSSDDTAPLKRTRVRSLLKPVVDQRRKRGTGEPA